MNDRKLKMDVSKKQFLTAMKCTGQSFKLNKSDSYFYEVFFYKM